MDPDPDPHHLDVDPQHCRESTSPPKLLSYLFNWIGNCCAVVPAQAAENHGAEGGPDGEPTPRPHQGQAHAVRRPSEILPCDNMLTLL